MNILQRDFIVRGGFDPVGARALGASLAANAARPHTKSALERATGVSRDALRGCLDALERA